MGFTRYWTVKGNVASSVMDAACRDIAEMLREEGAVGSVVAYEADLENLPPVCEQGTVRFNGIGEEGHETFYFTDYGWDFCKTARKPYDLYVAASLMLLKHHFGDAIDIDSDGGNEEEEAETLAFRYMSL